MVTEIVSVNGMLHIMDRLWENQCIISLDYHQKTSAAVQSQLLHLFIKEQILFYQTIGLKVKWLSGLNEKWSAIEMFITINSKNPLNDQCT